jgi:hypothetical protein
MFWLFSRRSHRLPARPRLRAIDLIQKRLRLAGFVGRGEWVVGATWSVEVSRGGQTVQVSGPGQTAAWERALHTVEALGVDVPQVEEDGPP